ncbi:hypothetical protein F5880DRAFT_1733971 [Lentinula raphanica]|nr:hypothetical protein F5880DRAFT_1733971 [Lentinula raphanica]
MVKILVGVVILSCFLQMGVTSVLAAPVVGKQSKAANVVAAGGSSANSRHCSRAALKVAKVPKVEKRLEPYCSSNGETVSEIIEQDPDAEPTIAGVIRSFWSELCEDMISEMSKVMMDRELGKTRIEARVKQVSEEWASSEESQENPNLIERVVWWWDQLANNGRLSKKSKNDYDYRTPGTVIYEDSRLLHDPKGKEVKKKLPAGFKEYHNSEEVKAGNLVGKGSSIGETSKEIVMPGLVNLMSLSDEKLEALVVPEINKQLKTKDVLTQRRGQQVIKEFQEDHNDTVMKERIAVWYDALVLNWENAKMAGYDFMRSGTIFHEDYLVLSGEAQLRAKEEAEAEARMANTKAKKALRKAGGH